MICPKCRAEYRDGFTICTDCDVKLVRQLPTPPVHATPPPDSKDFSAEYSASDLPSAEDPFCSFWVGDDPRVHAELRQVLEEAGIPCKTVRREDHVFRLTNISAMKIGVPFSLYEKAEAAVKDAFGIDQDGMDAVPLLPPPSSGQEDQSDSRADARAGTDFDPKHFSPEEATAEVWAGEDRYLAEFLVNSIATNEIHCRWDKDGTRHRLLVLPGDAERAREIVREVVEASPPSE
jgi:hypothetical protein